MRYVRTDLQTHPNQSTPRPPADLLCCRRHTSVRSPGSRAPGRCGKESGGDCPAGDPAGPLAALLTRIGADGPHGLSGRQRRYPRLRLAVPDPYEAGTVPPQWNGCRRPGRRSGGSR